MSDIGFTTEAISRVVTLTFRTGSGLTTIVGGAVDVNALNLATGGEVAGTATILTATTVKIVFAALSLDPGLWELQLLATPIGGEATVLAERITIRQGADA